MKRVCLIFIFLIFLIQFSFLPALGFNLIIPNLLLITAAIIGVRETSWENFFWFFLAGFIFEIFSKESFGINLLTFLLVGGLVWFLKNIILNKEKNILLEIIFWFLVKIIWDFSYKIIYTFWQFFAKTGESVKFFEFPVNYFKEILVFILFGILVTFLWQLLKLCRKNK